MDRFEKAYLDPIPSARRQHRFTANCVFTATLFAATVGLTAEAVDPDALKRLVHHDCGSCHGLTLQGGLGPDLRSDAIKYFDEDVLKGVILNGVPDTPMPPWRPLLSDAEAEWVARYLLQMENM